MKQTKIAFIYYAFSSFVKTDYEILYKHFAINRVEYNKIWSVFEIAKATLKSDISFSWFADGWAFFAVLFSKLFRKKSIIVVGGYDVACEPQINYGLCMKNKLRRWMRNFALDNADLLLPVSNSTKTECLKHLTHPRDLGVLYNSIDTDKFKPSGEKENNLVISVGGINWSNLERKGIKTFVKSAKFIPEVRFVVIGKFIDDSIDSMRHIATSNVEFTGFISDAELLKYYQKAKVYVQLSLHEGFGCSVAEAMLCECIPVVSERGALPEVAGETGFTATYGNEKATAAAIKEALKSNKGKEAGERIKKMFSVEKRENELIQLVERMVGTK